MFLVRSGNRWPLAYLEAHAPDRPVVAVAARRPSQPELSQRQLRPS